MVKECFIFQHVLTCAVFSKAGAIVCLLPDRELLLFKSKDFFDVEFCFSSNLKDERRKLYEIIVVCDQLKQTILLTL